MRRDRCRRECSLASFFVRGANTISVASWRQLNGHSCLTRQLQKLAVLQTGQTSARVQTGVNPCMHHKSLTELSCKLDPHSCVQTRPGIPKVCRKQTFKMLQKATGAFFTLNVAGRTTTFSHVERGWNRTGRPIHEGWNRAGRG